MGRRFWYDAYSSSLDVVLRSLDGIAAEQGSASADFVLHNYLSGSRIRKPRQEYMRDQLAAAFGRNDWPETPFVSVRSTATGTVARGLSVDSPRCTRWVFGRSRVGISDFEGRLTAARSRRQLWAADHYQSIGMPTSKKIGVVRRVSASTPPTLEVGNPPWSSFEGCLSAIVNESQSQWITESMNHWLTESLSPWFSEWNKS